MADTLLLRFAQEELAYLLRTLSIGMFPGLETEPLGNLDQEHQVLALAVADRTLRARGAITWDSQEKRHIDPIVAGVLRDCAQPRYTLLLDILRADKVKLKFLYSFGKHAVIEHYMPEPGVHQFAAVAAGEILAHLLNILAIAETLQSSGKVGRLSQEKLTAAHAADTSTNPDEAIRILATELSLETANDLASIIKNPKMTQHLALWFGMPSETVNREPGETLTVLQGDTGLFLLLKENAGISHFNVIPATVSMVREYVKTLLLPALETLPDHPASTARK